MGSRRPRRRAAAATVVSALQLRLGGKWLEQDRSGGARGTRTPDLLVAKVAPRSNRCVCNALILPHGVHENHDHDGPGAHMGHTGAAWALGRVASELCLAGEGQLT
jgi:hypothetical protein